jgi:hypothetical protein
MRKMQLLLFPTIVFANVNAQKLPNVQKTSLRAPADIKIDGKATEWGAQFQAYNTATELYYTIANDDKRLYLVFMYSSQNVAGNVSADRVRNVGGMVQNARNVVNNIVNGGIRINVQKDATRNDQQAPGVKFPYFEKGIGVNFGLRNMGAGDDVADSVIRANNRKLTANVKWIYTTGITGVDTVLSIYNDKGINAANAFDNKKNYICEIAIDLNLLGLSIDNPKKFTYHIIANGEPNKYSLIDLIIRNARGNARYPDGSVVTDAQFNATMDRMRADGDPGSDTTDFWGEYTLAK